MAAVLLVGFWVILFVVVVGIFERLFCKVFPLLKVLKYVVLFAAWPVVTWYLITQNNAWQMCFFEQFMWACVITIVYWWIVVSIKSLLVPFDILN
jgi:hypothetical protein